MWPFSWNLSSRTTATDWTQTHDKKWRRQQSHCGTTFTDETSNRLGLCHMDYVFYRLLSTTYFRTITLQQFYYITSLHSQLHHGLTDRWPTTCHDVIDQSDRYNQSTVYNTINWCDTTHFDSGDDYHTGCRNISHCQQQQSYSGLHSPRRSNSTYSWNDSWVQTFHSTI